MRSPRISQFAKDCATKPPGQLEDYGAQIERLSQALDFQGAPEENSGDPVLQAQRALLTLNRSETTARLGQCLRVT